MKFYFWSPWIGCSKVSPGCRLCAAEAADRTFAALCGESGHWGTSPRRLLGEEHWKEPLLWQEEAEQEGTHRTVAVVDCDVNEDLPELQEARSRFWGLVFDTPRLRWVVTTKRPENFARMLPCPCPANLTLAVSAETQELADVRVKELLRTPDPVLKALSFQPMLEPMELRPEWCRRLDWVACGAEVGFGARAMKAVWAERLLDQCERENLPFYYIAGPGEDGALTSTPKLRGRVWKQLPKAWSYS